MAVVLDRDGRTTEQMQLFTDWTNLSEATFLVPATRPGTSPSRHRNCAAGPLDEAALHTIALGLGLDRADIVDHQWRDNGPPWQTVTLRSAREVLAFEPAGGDLAGLFIGAIGPYPAGAAAQFEVRAFFAPNDGVREDPVTGSLNPAIGQWLTSSGQAPDRDVAAQGTRLGLLGARRRRRRPRRRRRLEVGLARSRRGRPHARG